MNMVQQILVGLVGLFCIAMAGQLMVAPEMGVAQFSISLTGIQGLSSARADLGGMFLATAILSFLGIKGGKLAAGFLFAAAIIMGSVALGRIIGFALDGIVQMTLIPFIFELIFVAVLVAGANATQRSNNRD
ncbi:MAG: DUF4345 family protein [Immundisolibacteraceae bacterium]|nr:DUF4345 family protein [Immundisolibacteraceae bacterium]